MAPQGKLAAFTAVIVASLVLSVRTACAQAGWTSSSVQLSEARAMSSVVFYNDSFVIIGGCRDVACTEMSRAINVFNAERQTMLQLPDLPIFVDNFGATLEPAEVGALLSGANSGSTASSASSSSASSASSSSGSQREPPPVGEQRVLLAGFYSAVTVGRMIFDDIGTLRVVTELWVAGMCGLYFKSNQGLDPQINQYRRLWRLSKELNEVVETVRIPDEVQARANASCIAFGNRVYIVGGIFLHNMSLTNTIDVYDTYAKTYTQSYIIMPECVMNAAVAVDSALLYVAGGQKSVSSDGSTTWGLAASTTVMTYIFPPDFWLNETLPLEPRRLPDNVHLAPSSTIGIGPFPEYQLPRVFSFAGRIVAMYSTSFFSVLDLVANSGKVDEAKWQLTQVSGTNSYFSTLLIFPFPDNFLGTFMTFYSFGGVVEEQQRKRGMSGVSTYKPASSIFLRLGGYMIPGPADAAVAYAVGARMRVLLTPPQVGGVYARLSSNRLCYGNIGLTMDVHVPGPPARSEATFLPLLAAENVFLCVAWGYVNYSSSLPQVLFYTAADPYDPMALLPKIEPLKPTKSPPPEIPPSSGNRLTSSDVLFVLIAGAVVFVVAFGIAVVAFRRSGRPVHDALQQGLSDDFIEGADDGTGTPVDGTDVVIRNTTSDSRYKVLRRIGSGSFSTVYLVKRKTDGEVFALKFMLCADDRERLEAIKECETINSLQGHPNIIQLYDMFMNYEFGQKRESVLSETTQAMLASGGFGTSMSGQSMQTIVNMAQAASVVRRESGLVPGTPPRPGANYGAVGPRASGLSGMGNSGATTHTPGSINSPPSPAVHTRYLCLVMEYLPAGDMARFVLHRSSNGVKSGDDLSAPRQPSPHALNESALLSVAFQLCSVLKHLHGQRPPVVHRDLKPENVLLRGRPTLKDSFLPIVVTDFGLAFIQEEHRRGGKGGGTRPYIAPECWKGNVSTASDIWSLGCVLYALATERVTSDTVRIMFVDARSPHFAEDIVYDLRAHRYSERFAHFVASLLVVDPRQRPTAAQLLTQFVVERDIVSLKESLASSPMAPLCPTPPSTTGSLPPASLVSNSSLPSRNE